MSDLISRAAAIDALGERPLVWDEWADEYSLGQRNQYDADKSAIEALPSAQPERKMGKWIEANTHIYGIYECTVCKAWTYIPNEPRDYNFCPRCGADMREVDNERV